MFRNRDNWSALSRLTHQWTMEDTEEVERERRRRVRSAAESDDELNPAPADAVEAGGGGHDAQLPQIVKSVEQVQLDFVELLRARDERRRRRQVETLRRQKEEEEGEAEVEAGGRVRLELLGDVDVEQSGRSTSARAPAKPRDTAREAQARADAGTAAGNSGRRQENGESQGSDGAPEPPSSQGRKFVSSVSISLDMSPSTSGRSTPMSPRSPSPPVSPREVWPSPCQSPVQNGHIQEAPSNDGMSTSSELKTAFVRQSSRTVSFRMLRKKEEDKAPLQRSASVRIASKMFEPRPEQNQDEDKASAFQRNSRQRVSSRSIQEKMERLAQASQRCEMMRTPDAVQRTLVLMEEVSRKRGLFEREQAASPTSPGVSRHEFRNLTSGMSDRINRWLSKSNQPSSSHGSTDVRHVDFGGKKNVFESREDRTRKDTLGRVAK